jgi:signal transduction histidine kinase
MVAGQGFTHADRADAEVSREQEQRLQRYNRKLVELARSKALEEGDLARAVREITEAAADALGVARASVWVYTDERAGIRCLDLYEVDKKAHSAGTELGSADFPGYFRALEEERTIPAHDAHTDPRTSEFSAPYLAPLGIGAMLDAPIRKAGKMIGVVCHEHIGPKRVWSFEEQVFAGSVADFVTLAMEAHERARADNARRRAEEVLLDRERRLRRHNELLVELGKSKALAEGDLPTALREITEVAARSLEVERASVWLYTADHAGIVCLDLFEAGKVAHNSGVQLNAVDFPRYFAALEEERTIAATDAHTDTRTGEFSEVYLRPLGIGAMLDAPIRQQGLMTGVVCHEHIGAAREWSIDEQNFAGSLADCVSLAIAASERKKAELALAERVADLARSNAELEQFAYVASHDLQEPLRMVSSYVALLEKRYKGKLDPDADKYIGYAVEGARRMRGLINDLLAYSRAGRREDELGPSESSRAIEGALANLRGLVEETGAEVVLGSMPRVMGNDTQLTQLFQNLIENALKYRGEAPPRVELGAQRDGAEWTFFVKDNGIGIEPQYAERIFRIFQRLHDRQKYAGSGIGLAIAKRIVERHRGRIWVEANDGPGATFRFTVAALEGSR